VQTIRVDFIIKFLAHKKYIPLDEKKKIDYKILKNCTKSNMQLSIMFSLRTTDLPIFLGLFFSSRQPPNANNEA